ncbi:ROK family protein [Ramlibacter monticola]|uniref:ROK family protein n=1 Tax=Ramlibacter monticola TaxID=1926872 RepID=A0A936YYY9_9BURK|nr:ROK family protein [Ramlibacter monticola]
MTAVRILAIDIGGSHLKASILDARGRMLTQKVTVKTPDPCPPRAMVDALVALVRPLPAHDRIAIGFPGVVRDGRVITAPHWVTKEWADFELPKELSRRLHGAPARMINDAEMQGLAVIKGKGLELVLTLGTGAGTGLFRDGDVMPHLELAHHPIRGNKTYDDYIGDAALKKVGVKRWNRRVARTVDILYALLHFDHLFIGGGNAANVSIKLPDNVSLVSNDAGIEGGAMLWRRDGQ